MISYDEVVTVKSITIRSLNEKMCYCGYCAVISIFIRLVAVVVDRGFAHLINLAYFVGVTIDLSVNLYFILVVMIYSFILSALSMSLFSLSLCYIHFSSKLFQFSLFINLYVLHLLIYSETLNF